MEKEGFVRPITYLKENGLDIGELVTYRHVQLIKYIREEMPDTSHHFDVWHVAKGIKFEKSAPFFISTPLLTHFNIEIAVRIPPLLKALWRPLD